MNFKIENNFLGITNYPTIERHFEKMASRGWLIDKIILTNIFIYKKIGSELLDFSISPYEIETEYTMKTKEELEEYNSACESVGWNYGTKSFNLHIYYKEQGSDALDIQTDEEEEFRTLESIAKKNIKSYYILIPNFLFLILFQLRNIFLGINEIKTGLTEVVVPIMIITITNLILNLIHMRRFLKANRRNIDLGKKIEFSDSKFLFDKISFVVVYIVLLAAIINVLHTTIILRNKMLVIAFIPVSVTLAIMAVYRIFIKPSKIPLKQKKVGYIVTTIFAVVMSILIFVMAIFSTISARDTKNTANLGALKVLSIQDFVDNAIEDDGDLIQWSSLLIPKSYEYRSYSQRNGRVNTEYSRAITEGMASNLVQRYIKEAERIIVRRYGRDLEFYFNEGFYHEYVSRAGYTEEDFNNLKDEDIKDAIKKSKEIIKEKSIVKDTKNLWNADEAYFLAYDKMEIVIRSGKEVYYLEGQDFSDKEIIKIVKEKLRI